MEIYYLTFYKSFVFLETIVEFVVLREMFSEIAGFLIFTVLAVWVNFSAKRFGLMADFLHFTVLRMRVQVLHKSFG